MKTIKIFTIICLLTASMHLYGWFIANATCDAFTPNTLESNGKESRDQGLGQLIMEGAGYFLKANGIYQLFLEKVEMSAVNGIGTGDLAGLIRETARSMELANDTYYQILQTAGQMEYNTGILAKLKHFDYRAYRASNRLNPSIFAEVEKLLKPGDVRGCYQYFYNQTLEILDRLKALAAGLETNPLPDIPACWRINQLIQETGLFGQYTTEVFMNSR